MKLELIPTITALLQQDAISIVGDRSLIDKLSEQIAMMIYFIPSFSNSTYPAPFLMLFHQPQIPLITESVDRPLSKQALYSIKISTEKLELLAHIHSNSDVVAEDAETKSMFCRTPANLKRLISH